MVLKMKSNINMMSSHMTSFQTSFVISLLPIASTKKFWCFMEVFLLKMVSPYKKLKMKIERRNLVMKVLCVNVFGQTHAIKMEGILVREEQVSNLDLMLQLNFQRKIISVIYIKYNINLELLVRSHEVKHEGYEYQKGGKTLTIFSAPNYCD